MIEVLPDIVSHVFLFCRLFSDKFGFQIKVIWPFFLPGNFPMFLDFLILGFFGRRPAKIETKVKIIESELDIDLRKLMVMKLSDFEFKTFLN